jgi:hypothetical protein
MVLSIGKIWASLAVVGALLAASPASSAEKHAHGEGELNLAIDGNEVVVELTAPGSDIVGFEHKPSTDADRKAAAAAAILKDGGALFAFPDKAGCKMQDADVQSDLMKDDQHDHGEHAEFQAHYRFRCETPDALSHVDVGYFKAFPRAEELEVQLITPKGQGAAELTASSSRLTF